jgi:hypothetical protein
MRSGRNQVTPSSSHDHLLSVFSRQQAVMGLGLMSWIGLRWYRYELWTGTYVLSAWEKLLFCKSRAPRGRWLGLEVRCTLRALFTDLLFCAILLPFYLLISSALPFSHALTQ